MQHEDKIQEILEAQHKILAKMENILLQQARIESDIESEKRTRADRNSGFDKEIFRLNDLIYNRDTGLAFQIDRLKIKDTEKDKRQDEMRKWIWGLLAAIILLFFKIGIDALTKK